MRGSEGCNASSDMRAFCFVWFVVQESESSARLYTEAASTDKELKLYEDGMHGELLHGGPTKRDLIERVFADCAGWLAGRSNRAV